MTRRSSLLLGLVAFGLSSYATGVRVDNADELTMAQEAAAAPEPLSAAELKKLLETHGVHHPAGSFQELVSVVEAEQATAGPRFTQVVAATAPASTACSWWQNNGATRFYKALAWTCGVAGEGQEALNAHIERVWGLIETARANLPTSSAVGARTLHLFLSPEWTFRRYPVGGTDYAPPLSYNEMHYILQSLLGRMNAMPGVWADWLVVPGSIYWGVPVSLRHKPTVRYFVFNTLPVMFNGKIVYTHNKFAMADNMDKRYETWGYDLMKEFHGRSGEPCKDYGDEGRICGTAEFVQFLAKTQGVQMAQAVEAWGVKQPASVLVINGLAVGMDICLDHRMTLGSNARAAERLTKIKEVENFDIQLLVSSGMRFDIPEEDGALSLTLRHGGVALSADGIAGPVESSRMFVKKPGASQIKWDARNGAVHYVVDQWRRTQLAKVSLFKDFDQMRPTLLGSWEDGCSRSASATVCRLCEPGVMQRDFPDASPTESQLFCKTQPGNWQMLKVYPTPVPLPEVQAGVVGLGWMDESGPDKALAVTPR